MDRAEKIQNKTYSYKDGNLAVYKLEAYTYKASTILNYYYCQIMRSLIYCASKKRGLLTGQHHHNLKAIHYQNPEDLIVHVVDWQYTYASHYKQKLHNTMNMVYLRNCYYLIAHALIYLIYIYHRINHYRNVTYSKIQPRNKLKI